jgi:hypothetical protein
MGCNGGKGGAPIATSDATDAKSAATSDERVRNQRRSLPSRRNNRPSAAERLTAQFDERRMELRDQRVKR